MRKLLLLTFCTLAGCTVHNSGGDVSVQPITDRIGDWHASLTPVNNSGVMGAVDARSEGLTAAASITIGRAKAGAQHPWHIHRGGCGDGGAIVGAASAYPVLSVGSNGTATASASIDVGLNEDSEYSVNVHQSPSDLGTIIACGPLKP